MVAKEEGMGEEEEDEDNEEETTLVAVGDAESRIHSEQKHFLSEWPS